MSSYFITKNSQVLTCKAAFIKQVLPLFCNPTRPLAPSFDMK